jgi:hypothetical protein
LDWIQSGQWIRIQEGKNDPLNFSGKFFSIFGHQKIPGSGLDTDRIALQPKMLDPDPESINLDLKPLLQPTGWGGCGQAKL